MACVLCFEDGTEAIERFIDIFSEEICELNVCKIISKHLWFKPEKEISLSQRLCWNCWVTLRDFHIFYRRVAQLHLTDWKYPYTCNEQEQDNDPLPKEILLKFEGDNEEKSRIIQSLTEKSFDDGIKLEVHDLSQVEIIEELETAKVKKRGRPRKNEKCLSRRKKTENTGLTVFNDLDSENELPLPVLFAAGKTVVGSLENSSEILSPTQDNHSAKKVTEPPNKPRGRPRKVKRNEITLCTIAVNECSNEAKLYSIERTKSEITIENPPLDYNNDNDPVGLDVHMSGIHETEDSESSSTDTNDSYGPAPQYAIINKKKVVKPKKYRKRSQPIKPRNRMTREEIEARKAQQEEYEKLIKKFFVHMSCSLCDLLVHNFTELREHLRSSHNIDPGYMMCCGRKFFQRKTLADHIYLHWNPEHFKCKICGEVCSSSRLLAEHEEGHADPTKIRDRKTFQCDKCQCVYSTKAVLQQHFFTKHVPKSEFKFTCSDCNKKFPTKHSLKGHQRKTHDPRSTIICDKCGKHVRTNYIKKHHLSEHSEGPRPVPEPQQCQICGTWLRHRSGLKQHMKTIHDDSGVEHRCKICNKVSTTARALRRHIYHNHECERKFKCTMCEKAFKRPQDLREHTSVHTGKVLYNCPNCSMAFFSSANMYKHRQRRHHAEYEADKKKPKHLLNIMAQSRDRLDWVSKEELPSAIRPFDPIII